MTAVGDPVGHDLTEQEAARRILCSVRLRDGQEVY